jgi:hypothetical protein
MPTYVSPFTGDIVQPTDVSYRSFTLSANTTLEWPLANSNTGTYASRIMEVLPTTSGLTLRMPAANATSVGTDSLIRNLGASSFTVADNAGNTIVTIAAGEAQYVYVTTNSTAAGTWGVIAFGIGSSGADAAALAGKGLLAITTTLNQSHPVLAASSGSTFTTADRAQTRLWSGGAGSYTLPAAATLGDNWFVLVKNNGTGAFTISTTGVELIDGASAKVFNPGESAFIVCTGTAYITVGYGVNANFAFTALVKSVAPGGTTTLNSSEASNNIQTFTGALTSNATVIYPPVVNLYVVNNQTSGSFTLTLSTGLGATTTVAQGTRATVICDGTNFYTASSASVTSATVTLVDGTVVAPSLSFASETGTGIWRPAAGQLAIAVTGVNKFLLTSDGLAGGAF